eukprot:9468370-Pyramimonas_sp.AAC.1
MFVGRLLLSCWGDRGLCPGDPSEVLASYLFAQREQLFLPGHLGRLRRRDVRKLSFGIDMRSRGYGLTPAACEGGRPRLSDGSASGGRGRRWPRPCPREKMAAAHRS